MVFMAPKMLVSYLKSTFGVIYAVGCHFTFLLPEFRKTLNKIGVER
jgi:hypothetical protein